MTKNNKYNLSGGLKSSSINDVENKMAIILLYILQKTMEKSDIVLVVNMYQKILISMT